ncbi:hypothetical protein IKU74_08950 [bacterium]|nr:hypothetical protein [bacterium]
MSMNGVNNLNKAEIAKLALAQKSGKTSSAQKPEHMTQNGSIFKAPETQQTEKPKNPSELRSLNVDNLKTKSQCEQALKDIETFTENNPLLAGMFRGKVAEIKAKRSEISHQASMQNLSNITNGMSTDNKTSQKQGVGNEIESKQAEAQEQAKKISADQGKKMAANMNETSSDVQSRRAETEQNTKKADNFSSNAQKDQKTLVKQQKSLQQQQKAFNKEIQENQKEIATLTEEMDQQDAEVKTLQDELATLTAGDNTGIGVNSAFSLSLAGTQEHQEAQQAEDPNAARIADLQAQIGEKTAAMEVKGQRIGKLQTTTNKQIKTMHKVTTRYMAGINRTQKNLETNQSTTQKILKVANTVDEISTTVQKVGQTLDYTGKALVALGSSTSWCFGAGTALIAAGTFMQKAGAVAQVAGQYGSLAANVTKTACYAAEGNITGALTSAASAVASGTSAIKGTKEMGQTFDKISDKADEATQKLAANVVAKEAAKEAAEEATTEATKSQLTDAAKSEAMSSFEGKSAKEVREIMNNETSAIRDNAVANAKDGAHDFIDATKGMSKKEIKEGIKNGTIKVGSTASEAVKEAAKEVKKEKTSVLNAGNIQKGLGMAAKISAQFNPQQNVGKTKNKATYNAPPATFAQWNKLNSIAQNRTKRLGVA